MYLINRTSPNAGNFNDNIFAKSKVNTHLLTFLQQLKNQQKTNTDTILLTKLEISTIFVTEFCLKIYSDI